MRGQKRILSREWHLRVANIKDPGIKDLFLFLATQLSARFMGGELSFSTRGSECLVSAIDIHWPRDSEGCYVCLSLSTVTQDTVDLLRPFVDDAYDRINKADVEMSGIVPQSPADLIEVIEALLKAKKSSTPPYGEMTRLTAARAVLALDSNSESDSNSSLPSISAPAFLHRGGRTRLPPPHLR